MLEVGLLSPDRYGFACRMPDGQIFCDDCNMRITEAGAGFPEPFADGDENLPQPAKVSRQVYFAPGDAFAQHPGSPIKPSPGIAEHQQQGRLDYRYPRPPDAGEGSTARSLSYRNSLIAAATSGGCGLVVFASTFLPWISFGGLFNASGWSYMTNSSELGGNFLWYSGPGYLFFTGFFSMLVGLAVIAGAALFLFRSMAIGARTAQVAGGWGPARAYQPDNHLLTHRRLCHRHMGVPAVLDRGGDIRRAVREVDNLTAR